MKQFYICKVHGQSGIARYAEDFFRLVLAPRSYEHVAPGNISAKMLEGLNPASQFHLELGASQHEELAVLLMLLDLGFRNISVTLHDPPFITFPYYRFHNVVLNRFSRAFDWYFNTFGANRRVLSKCRNVFVLSKRGEEMLKSRYGLNNVHYIPHIIDPAKIKFSFPCPKGSDILFFGFIGRRKGLDYALQMHAEIRQTMPEIKLHVIGEAVDSKTRDHLASLKRRFKTGVIYHGFVPENQLDKIFDQVTHVFLPFQEYRYLCPVSGSVLNALRRGKVVWTNPVNAIPEIVQDGVNGVWLTSELPRDLNRFFDIQRDHSQRTKLSLGATTKVQEFGPSR